MDAPQKDKRKSPTERDSPRKHARLNGAHSSSPRPQTSSTSASPLTQKSTKRTMADPDLNSMNPAEREVHYERRFGNKTERSHTLCFPTDLTDEYPDLADKINAAYLRYTIFTVEVWMNYDPASQRFFNDECRAQDCGKLKLPVARRKKRKKDEKDEEKAEVKGVRERLKGVEFGRVRFEVCTPFARLGSILVEVLPPEAKLPMAPQDFLDSEGDGDRMRLRVKRGFRNQDELFQKGLHLAFGWIKIDFLPSGGEGLCIKDLEAIASYFRIRPKLRHLTLNEGWVRDTDVWMNFFRKEERNGEGYVERLD